MAEPPTTRELEWLRRARDLAQLLGSEDDPGRIPPLILQAALELTGAQRAFLVSVEGLGLGGDHRLRVLAARGFAGALQGPAGEVSRRVVERCLSEGGRSVITSRPEDAGLVDATSVVGRGVRSMVAVPLRVRGAPCGVLYLDHRGEEALFREADLPVLQTFATHAALSLELGAAGAPARAGEARFLIGRSPPLQALLEELSRAARSPEPVLILGEPGTERGWVARELHAREPGRELEFRNVEAGALDPGRLLGERGQPGLLARPVFLHLEDVEALESELQRQLARALEGGAYTVPGGAQRVTVAARVVASSGEDLAARVAAGSFRPELYYRLDVLRVVVPPLRQRAEDLGALWEALDVRLGPPHARLSESALERLQRYAWPGNLLELEAELRRVRAAGVRKVRVADLKPEVVAGRGVVHATPSFSGKTLGELEEELVRQAMRDSGGVKARAARQLGIPRSTLYHLLQRYGLE